MADGAREFSPGIDERFAFAHFRARCPRFAQAQSVADFKAAIIEADFMRLEPSNDRCEYKRIGFKFVCFHLIPVICTSI